MVLFDPTIATPVGEFEVLVVVAWNALDAAIVVQDYNHLLHNSTVALLHRSKSDEVLVAVDDCS